MTGKGHVNIELNYQFAILAVRILNKIKIKLFENEAAKYGGLVWYMNS
jgi:hypothetical protein